MLYFIDTCQSGSIDKFYLSSLDTIAVRCNWYKLFYFWHEFNAIREATDGTPLKWMMVFV